MAKKSVAKKPAGRPSLVIKKGKCSAQAVKPAIGGQTKIRVGFICNKWHDPIPVGTQDREYPEDHKCHNNHTSNPNAVGWGGMFHVDVSVGLQVLRLHPDIFEVDFIKGSELTPARVASNHINFNMWYDVMCALNSGNKTHISQVIKAQKAVNMWPTWEYADWIYHKIHYMKQLIKAGIPMIPTIFIENGFDPAVVLKKVQAMGWSKFFVKPAHWGMFGNGAIHGKTQDFIDDPSLLEKFRKEETKGQKEFLVQPYMLKPDGKVFDEVRHYFLDGEWGYAVYTDGTDENAVYPEPDGYRKEVTKKLALKAFDEVLKVTKWCGKGFVPTFTRIDVGIIPMSANSTKVKAFVNEVEMEMCTWLCRYCPFNLVQRMGPIYVKKARELLTGLLKAKKTVKNKVEVKKLLEVLDERLGPL
mmetsp:Transcript_23637/g.55102  ORF Transcript_23637/g.55102 Transcript_23637/m.55102 type:complete len:415 (+) Transcript_23637:86-1330(+)